MEFELPPLVEQHEIVHRVETLFAFADRLETHYIAGHEQIYQLIPSLLDKGEQQLLTVLGLMRFTRNAESLYFLDEPDTHLNPAWGVDYLEHLRNIGEIDKNSHTILTTHDPLLVSGLCKNEIRVLHRNKKGQIVANEPEESPRGRGVAGVLTSPLFGLESQLDPYSLRVLKQIYEISSKEKYPNQQRDLEDLRKLVPGLTPDEISPDPYQNIARMAYEIVVNEIVSSDENPDWKIEAIDKLSSKFIDQKRVETWGNGALLKSLRGVVGNKCWYSEVSLVGADPNVDHFRPKGGVVEIDSSTLEKTADKSPGYWWLAFEPKNFRLCCMHSNQRRVDEETEGGKWDFFPIEGARTPEGTEWDLIEEDVLPFDPCCATDMALLWFSPDGTPTLKNVSPSDEEIRRLKVTIWLFHLDKKEIAQELNATFRLCQGQPFQPLSRDSEPTNAPFYISSSGHLCRLFNLKILSAALLRLRFCGTEQKVTFTPWPGVTAVIIREM